ncbi:MAG: hypothetical protein K5779_09745 [Saccharofermentans sp.]|nr:hypothetical protein [Saccharofermentans sp.]
MNRMGIGKKTVLLCLVAVFAFAGTACTEKLYPDATVTQATVQTTVDPMSFSVIDAKFRDYTFGINEYMREHGSEVKQNRISGSTPNGVAAECTYTISPDSKYESLQMEKRLDNAVQVDEYFNLGDSVFVARTTIYDDGNFDPVDKYYIIDGGLYKVDGLAGTVTKLADTASEEGGSKKTELDLFYSFDEIRTIYG